MSMLQLQVMLYTAADDAGTAAGSTFTAAGVAVTAVVDAV